MTKTCENCRWWNYWGGVLMTDDEPRHLGHCEPLVSVPDMSLPPSYTAKRLVRGLVASDYTCGEWKESGNGNN